MPFQKGHKLGAKKIYSRPMSKMIGVRAYEGQLEAIAQVPEWQEKVRQFIDQLIEEHNKKGVTSTPSAAGSNIDNTTN